MHRATLLALLMLGLSMPEPEPGRRRVLIIDDPPPPPTIPPDVRALLADSERQSRQIVEAREDTFASQLMGGNRPPPAPAAMIETRPRNTVSDLVLRMSPKARAEYFRAQREASSDEQRDARQWRRANAGTRTKAKQRKAKRRRRGW